MNADSITLSVIVPVYNEEKNLCDGRPDEIYNYLLLQDFGWEIIFVNDGSTDQSKRVLEEFSISKKQVQIVEISHGGKPEAVWAGIQRAKGRLILFTDLDQSTPINQLEQLLPFSQRGFDVVIGSRGLRRQGFSLIRIIGSWVFRIFRRLIILKEIKDTQCGFKLCRRQVALNIFPMLCYFQQTTPPVGWKVSAFDVELLFLMKKAGYKIKEIPVLWQDRDLSDTKYPKKPIFQYLHESIEMALEVFRVKSNQIKKKYH